MKSVNPQYEFLYVIINVPYTVFSVFNCSLTVYRNVQLWFFSTDKVDEVLKQWNSKWTRGGKLVSVREHAMICYDTAMIKS